jgi:hypothetical protein
MPAISDPQVILQAREFREALRRREETQMREMAQAWLRVERQLSDQISGLVSDVATLRASGETVTPGMIARMDRYQELRRQVAEEYQKYAGYADGVITGEQRSLAALGIDNASDLLSLQVKGAFNRLPADAVEIFAGLAGDGRPIGNLLRERVAADLAGAFDKVQAELLKSVAQGISPIRTARAIKDSLAGGYRSAITIARTEQLRIYRMATWEQYKATGMVNGQRRIAAHDGRVCAACLADEGTIYYGPIPDHPQGRCSGIPVIANQAEPEWKFGEAWLKDQPVSTQEDILGAGYGLWRDGQVGLSSFLTMEQHPVWGATPQVTPVKQLREIAGGTPA